MKSANPTLNTELLKALEGLFTAVGEALIEQEISPTRALSTNKPSLLSAKHAATAKNHVSVHD